MEKKVKKLKKQKKSKIHKKQHGGDDVISASINAINAMKSLGQSIFNEIYSITHIQQQINTVSQVTAIPTVSGPPSFNAPRL